MLKKLAVHLEEGLAEAGRLGFDSPISDDPGTVVGLFINIVLGVLGVIFLVLTIYAGFLWMTAAGNEEQVKKAKHIVVQAVIGLVITLSAYAISDFVINQLTAATGTG